MVCFCIIDRDGSHNSEIGSSLTDLCTSSPAKSYITHFIIIWDINRGRTPNSSLSTGCRKILIDFLTLTVLLCILILDMQRTVVVIIIHVSVNLWHRRTCFPSKAVVCILKASQGKHSQLPVMLFGQMSSHCRGIEHDNTRFVFSFLDQGNM